MPEHREHPAKIAASDAAFPSRKAAPPLTLLSEETANARHHYRITVDRLDVQQPTTGEGGLESLSFFASTLNDISAAIGTLRQGLDCSSCHAAKLAVGLSLIREVMHAHRDRVQLHETLLELFRLLESTPTQANA
jgi:hypothetical protein